MSATLLFSAWRLRALCPAHCNSQHVIRRCQRRANPLLPLLQSTQAHHRLTSWIRLQLRVYAEDGGFLEQAESQARFTTQNKKGTKYHQGGVRLNGMLPSLSFSFSLSLSCTNTLTRSHTHNHTNTHSFLLQQHLLQFGSRAHFQVRHEFFVSITHIDDRERERYIERKRKQVTSDCTVTNRKSTSPPLHLSTRLDILGLN